jgi:hypothetical protein
MFVFAGAAVIDSFGSAVKDALGDVLENHFVSGLQDSISTAIARGDRTLRATVWQATAPHCQNRKA